MNQLVAGWRSRLPSVGNLLPGSRDLVPVRSSWRSDLVAGVTVGIVALPLALAFGASAGLGPAAGLVTAIVAGFVAAVFGGSHVQVSGPTGAMVVVLAPAVAEHGVSSVAVLCLLAGIILVALGALRLGRAVGVIPWPVIEGFTVGIAVIIAAQQIPAVFSTSAPVGQNAVVAAADAASHAGSQASWSVGLTVLVVVIMVAGQRISARFPASLLAVAVATVVAQLTHAPVERIGALPEGLPAPTIPQVSPDLIVTLLPAAFAIAMLSAIESLLSAKVAGTMADVGELEPDRELVGQGLATLASGAFGGMPATGAIARTAVNVSSGGRSRLSAITHAVVLLLVVVALGGLVSQIPLAALAGVLLVVSTRMIDFQAIGMLFRSTRSAVVIFLATAVITVAFDLVEAVLIGVVIAAFFALRHLASVSEVHREPLPGPAAPGDDRIALLTLSGPMFFAAAERLADTVLATEADVVILRMSQLTMLDATGARSLAELVSTLQRRGVTVLIKGVQVQHVALTDRTGLTGVGGTGAFTDLSEAVTHARNVIATRFAEG